VELVGQSGTIAIEARWDMAEATVLVANPKTNVAAIALKLFIID
jgi:hypothetical protein